MGAPHTPQNGPMTHQPFLHDLSVCLAAPVQVWSRRDGDLDGVGAAGAYVGDTRVLSRVRVTIADADGPVELAHLTTAERGGGAASYVAMVRVAADIADPLVSLTRTRTAGPDGLSEELTVASSLERTLALELVVSFEPDATPLNLIKAGRDRVRPTARTGTAWQCGPAVTASLTLPQAEIDDAGDTLVARWRLSVPADGARTVTWRLDARDDALPFVAFRGRPLAVPDLADASPALARLVRRSVADLNALRLAERATPDVGFVAAGAPWYLTLFGRDSLVAARLFLPAGWQLALDTLRTLAARQGRRFDVDGAEAPGKILHEVRRAPLDLLDGTILPAEYYGTIDATPLWICLLGQAWRAGAPEAEIVALLDPLRAALDWLGGPADADGDGFLEYFDQSGHGLANQGWKDSGDSVRFADGTIAEGPIALAEVQGYAYQAARTASELLTALGRTAEERAQAARWGRFADELAARFRERFWVRDAAGPYPALALDAHKVPVTGVASNMGHLLGTGILSAEEERVVVARLLDPGLFSGYGVRTMSTANGAYWPARYHVGSVWTHDTALIIEGLLDRGFDEEARVLAEGLLRAAEGFGDQLPELFGGQSAAELFPPAPYPAACHPQAWAAASAITLARALGVLGRET